MEERKNQLHLFIKKNILKDDVATYSFNNCIVFNNMTIYWTIGCFHLLYLNNITWNWFSNTSALYCGPIVFFSFCVRICKDWFLRRVKYITWMKMKSRGRLIFQENANPATVTIYGFLIKLGDLWNDNSKNCVY
jgi:hypothetical protein